MDAKDFTARVRGRVLSNKAFNKLFCIGFNKTGTTTLEGVLRLYGYAMPDQQEQSLRLTKPCFAGNYAELSAFVPRYDAFQDLPFSQGEIYVVADALFPDSRFILSERDGEDWFASLCAFHRTLYGIEDLHSLTPEDIRARFTYLYEGFSNENIERLLTRFDGGPAKVRWDLLYDKDYYIAQYLARNERIKNYFRNCPERLLVIDVTREKTTAALCAFLGIPGEFTIAMPRLNKT